MKPPVTPTATDFANSAPPTFVLASSSPYRKAQLESRFNLQLQCISPYIDESPLVNETPTQTALRLSALKALAVCEQLSHESTQIIIAGDQTAEWNRALLKKPGNHENALAQLTELNGQYVCFYSGVCVMNSITKETYVESTETRVKLRNLSPALIERYIQQDQPYDCVGAFKNETAGIALFESIESNDPTALTGLPLIALTRLLNTLGVELLSF
ncbi:MAG: Maf family nucleotide pyrophosphatase [Agarilytica sp.]